MLNRTSPPAFHPIEGFPIISPQEITFSNGIKAFVFDSGEQDLVRVQWVFENLAFDLEEPLRNSALAGMLLEGTNAHNSAKIAEMVDFYGAFLQPEYSFDHTSLSLFSLNKHVEKLIPLVFEILTDAIFPEKELATYIRNNKQSLLISLEKNDYVARRSFNHALFGDSRYGYSHEIADLDHIERNALNEAFEACFSPGNCTLFIAGKVAPSLIDILSTSFGKQWEKTNRKLPGENLPAIRNEADLIFIEKPQALQSAIRLGHRSIQRSHPDFPGFQVLNTALGGYFGSRLMANIREDKGYTYGIGSGIASMQYAGFFTISTEVGTAVCAATLQEIKKEIDRLKVERIGAEELTLVKNYILGSMMGSLETIFSHADKFKQAYFSGLDLDYYGYYTDVVKSITAEDLLALANRYLDYDSMIKIVVGKM